MARGSWLQEPRPGFYVLRLKPGAPLVPAVIYALCPMVVPRPGDPGGPDPDEWCRPLRSLLRYDALINGQAVAIERVLMARSLRRVSAEEYAFRMGPLDRWRKANLPQARPDSRVDLARLPALY